MNREPSWWHMLWIILMVLWVMRNDKEGIMEDDEETYSGLIEED